MNFTSDFRNKELVVKLINHINKHAEKPIRLMEVCGGHTMAIRKYGIQTLLPPQVELLSGPGCPVCVTDQSFIDLAIAYAQQTDTVLLTYGDMLRVPGTRSSLDQAKAAGARVQLIYSSLQALDLARKNPDTRYVFAAIGFETTIPGTAVALQQAKKEKLKNFLIICAHKTMPQAMESLVEEGIKIDGYIGPGHVCSISGSKIFENLANKYHLPIVVAGFEPIDLLQSILALTEMIHQDEYGVRNYYKRLVKQEGNLKAQALVNEIFEPCDQHWRGIGLIPRSGMKLRDTYREFDATLQVPLKVESGPEPKGCLCGQILKGLKKPTDCKLFGKVCKPENPVGACMVSSEGACNAFYQYQTIG